MMEERFINTLLQSSKEEYNIENHTASWEKGFICALEIVLEVNKHGK
jgi:hypothetical protein